MFGLSRQGQGSEISVALVLPTIGFWFYQKVTFLSYCQDFPVREGRERGFFVLLSHWASKSLRFSGFSGKRGGGSSPRSVGLTDVRTYWPFGGQYFPSYRLDFLGPGMQKLASSKVIMKIIAFSIVRSIRRNLRVNRRIFRSFCSFVRF